MHETGHGSKRHQPRDLSRSWRSTRNGNDNTVHRARLLRIANEQRNGKLFNPIIGSKMIEPIRPIEEQIEVKKGENETGRFRG